MHVLKLDDRSQLHDLADSVSDRRRLNGYSDKFDAAADYRLSRLLALIEAAKAAPEVPQDSAWQPPSNISVSLRMKAQDAEKAWRTYFANPMTEASLWAAQLTADYLHEVANG